MGKRKDMPVSFDGMEERFFNAIGRIKEGKPECPELAKKAWIGKLRLTVSAVALEAGAMTNGKWKGLSRTSIGHTKCRYPKVYAAIMGEDDAVPDKSDLRSINRDLREKNRDLERQLKLALAEQAALYRQREAREKEVKDKLGEIARVQARGNRSADSMAMTPIRSNIAAIRNKEKE
jgi:hypothetical protein